MTACSWANAGRRHDRLYRPTMPKRRGPEGPRYVRLSCGRRPEGRRYVRLRPHAAPESPRRRQHVEVRHVGRRAVAAMERPPRVHCRDVERPAVVGDEQRRLVEDPAQRVEHRRLPRRAGEEELPHAKAAVLEPAAAGEKRHRAGAAGESRGLDVEKHDATRPVRIRVEPRVEQTDRRLGGDDVGLEPSPAVEIVRLPRRVDRDESARSRPVRGAAEDRCRLIEIERGVAGVGNVRELTYRALDSVIRHDARAVPRRSSGHVLLDDRAKPGLQVARHQAATRRAVKSSSRCDATDFASGPVAPSGPTHEGQPD